MKYFAFHIPSGTTHEREADGYSEAALYWYMAELNRQAELTAPRQWIFYVNSDTNP